MFNYIIKDNFKNLKIIVIMITNIATLLRTSTEVLTQVKRINPHMYNQQSLNVVKFIMFDFYNNLSFAYNDLKQYINTEDVNQYGYHKYTINTPDNNMLNLSLSVITWLPDAETPLHYHDNNSCLTMPIVGNLEQDILYSEVHDSLLLPKCDKIYKRDLLFEGNISYIDDEIGKHIIRNVDNDIVVSLNMYHHLGKN